MVKFYKYHGAGNDFIMIDNRDKHFDTSDTDKVKLLCNRNFGIGADGLILVENSEKADCFMNYYNSDGTLAEMCANGVRCTTKFFLEHINPDLKKVSVETRAGVKEVAVNTDSSFSVNMGTPTFTHPDFPNKPTEIENNLFKFVSMGNPHAVAFVKNISEININEIGPNIETNSHFPNKINTEFVEKVNDKEFKVKVWERGSGPTLACGSGACAIFAVLKKENPALGEITLEFPGGNLYLSEENGQIILRGPATFVFEGDMLV